MTGGTTAGDGGCLRQRVGSLALSGTTISGCAALGANARGGGMYLQDVGVVGDTTTVTANTVLFAPQGGGAYLDNSPLPAGVKVTGNTPSNAVTAP